MENISQVTDCCVGTDNIAFGACVFHPNEDCLSGRIVCEGGVWSFCGLFIKLFFHWRTVDQ
jgi:hypothetical protein